MTSVKWEIGIGNEKEREVIYQLSHTVYACELHQHSENLEQKLSDKLDIFNIYIVARCQGQIAGFISITPPRGDYSIDKYLRRNECPFEFNDKLYEIRLLTVLQPYRGKPL